MSYEKMYNNNFIVSVSTSGSNDNGGLFAYGSTGTDRTDQDAAYVDVTASGDVTATTKAGTGWQERRTVILDGYDVVSADIGNVFSTTVGGSGSNVYEGMFEITAVDTTENSWRMGRDVRSSSGDSTPEAVLGKMGGSLADPFYYREKMNVYYSTS